MAKTVPVVVTLSGKIDLSVEDNMTAEDIIKYVQLVWNINKETIDQPFLVVSNMNTGENTLYENGDAIYASLNDKSVVKVVLPLAIKNDEDNPKVLI